MRSQIIYLCLLAFALQGEQLSPAAPAVSSAAAHQQFVFAYRVLQRTQQNNDPRDLELAADAFDEYLGRFPDDNKKADALFFRALIARLQNNNQSAEWYLAKGGKTKMVPDYQVRLLHGQILSDMGRHQNALDHLKKISAEQLDPQVRAMVWQLRGLCYQHVGKTSDAVAALRATTTIKSSLQAQALLDLARLQEGLGNRAEALRSLDQCLKLEKTALTAEAARLAGDLHYESSNYEQALANYDLVLRNHIGSEHFTPCIIGTMWSQLSADRYDQLLTTFERYRDQLPQNENRVTAWYLAASAYQEKGEHELAVAFFEEIRNSAQGKMIEDKVLFKLANSQYELNNFSKMHPLVSQFQELFPGSPLQPDIDFLLATAAARQGRTNEAAAMLTAIVDANPVHPYRKQALLQRGSLYEIQQHFDAAITDYSHYLKTSDADNQTQIHNVIIRLMDLSYRTDRFQESITWGLRGINAKQNGFAKKPEPQIEQELLYRLALAYIKLENFEEANNTLTALLSRHPQNQFRLDALYHHGLVLLTRGKMVEAIACLQQVSESTATSNAKRRHALRLISMHFREIGQHEPAAQALLTLKQISGEGAQHNLKLDELVWMGRYLHGKGEYKKALHLLEPLSSMNTKLSAAARGEVLFLIARCHRQLNDHESAIIAYRSVVAISSKYGLQAILELGHSLKDAGHYEQAIEEYTGLMNSPRAAMSAEAELNCGQIYRAIAHRMILAGNTQGAQTAKQNARKLLLRLILLRSDPRISPLGELGHLELAEVEQELGKPQIAIDLYRELLQKFPNGPHATYAKAMIARKGNHHDQARVLLRELNGQNIEPQLAYRVKHQMADLGLTP